ncbi:hypothetical protein FCOIX_5983 [Fusarium coicis]|nr:hypothetical protein FCOIX_5983 [Fusarium coicis]
MRADAFSNAIITPLELSKEVPQFSLVSLVEASRNLKEPQQSRCNLEGWTKSGRVVATSLPNSSTDNLAILGINIASLRHKGTVRDIVCLILTGLIRLEYGTLPHQLSSSSLMARHYLPMIPGKVNIGIHPDFERPMLFAGRMAEVFVAG